MKHAIGRNHNKYNEWIARDGISRIEEVEGYRGSKHFGMFIVYGKAPAVDSLMEELHSFLQRIRYAHNYLL